MYKLAPTRKRPKRVAKKIERRFGLAHYDRGAILADRRTRREDRLRALGFEDPTNDERRERLARNAALKDWPT